MSIYIQEVLGLLKRNKKKIKLDKIQDHFEFGKLYHHSTLNTGVAYQPTMEPFVIQFGDLVCEITENLTRTQIGSGNVGFMPVYTTPEGSCAWDTLMDSIVTQNAIGDTITINNGNLIVDLQLTAGSANILDLTEDRIVIVGPNGELEDDANFTMDGNLFTALLNVQHGTVTASPNVPITTTTINSNLILNGPITDSLGNVGGLAQVLVGLADGRVVWSNDDVVEALTYGALWQGNSTNLKQELLIGSVDQILISDGTTFAWQDNPSAIVGEICSIYRIPLWTPNANTLGCSLLIQDGNSGTPATQIQNDGILKNVGIVKLDSVSQDDTLTEILVRDPASANEVKYRDASSLIPLVGFDTLANGASVWTQTYLNAYVGLDDTAGLVTTIQDMTTLTDGQHGAVIAENIKTGSALNDNVIRFPDGWGVAGNLFDNRVTWTAGVQNGYPTSTLLYGESVKFSYINYNIPAPGINNMIYWDACCKTQSANTCPVAYNQNLTTQEDTAVSNTANVVDDGYGGYTTSFHTVSGLSIPAAGSLVFNLITGAYTFTPSLDWYGTVTFTYIAFDGYCDSNVATVSIIVIPVAEPPLWTSTDPVTAATYPNLTGGDTWTYNWTTNDPDHACSQLNYVITVDGVEIFPTLNASWLTFTDNGNCTGTLTGTYPNAGGNYVVVMTVADPDPNADVQTFTIGGLSVTQNTYFTFWSDTSGSMHSTIEETAQMCSIPTTVGQSDGSGSGTTTFAFKVTTYNHGRVSAPLGDTDDSRLCVIDGMEVSGAGIPANTTVVSGGGNNTIVLSNAHTTVANAVITFTLTSAQKAADYVDTTNFRNLLQDYYATGATEASGNTNTVTNGRDMYDSHMYWCHSPLERQISQLGNKGLGGTTAANLIGPTGYFPNADTVIVMGFADEAAPSYDLSGTGAGGWQNRAYYPPNANIVTDVNVTKTFITNMEAASGNNTIYRGISFRVDDSGHDNNLLEEILGDGSLMSTGGVNANGFLYPPQAAAYNTTTETLYPESSGSPTRIIYEGNVTDGGGSTYYYNLIKAQLNLLGFGL